MRYEWKNDRHGMQLWDNQRGCWVMWSTIGGKIGVTDEFAQRIADCLNDDSPHENMILTVIKLLRMWQDGDEPEGAPSARRTLIGIGEVLGLEDWP